MSFEEADLLAVLADFPNLQVSPDDRLLSGVVHGWNQSNAQHKEKYQFSWSRYLELIGEDECLTGLDLPAALRILDGHAKSGRSPVMKWVSDQVEVDQSRFADAPAGQYVEAVDGRYQLTDGQIAEDTLTRHLRPHLRPETEAVIELGGGCGRNLGRLLQHSGRRDLTYVNCEQSAAGLEVYSALMRGERDVAFQALPFDFNTADFSVLREFGEILVFTCAAVEQIPFLARDFIPRILDAAPGVTLAFYEPVGWQRFSNVAEFVLAGFCRELAGQVEEQDLTLNSHVFAMQDEMFIDNAACWALAGRYNMNLLTLVKQAADSGQAQLQGLEWDVFGPNPLNPYSFICLRKA